MNIESLVKNKFIIAIPIALLLVVCLKKFNKPILLKSIGNLIDLNNF